MMLLWDGLSHIPRVLRTDSVTGLYVAAQIATLLVTGIALCASRVGHLGLKLRRSLAGLVAFARTVASRSVLAGVLKEAREMRRQRDVAAATIAHLRRMEANYEALATNDAEMRRQRDVAAATIAHLRRIEANYEVLATDHAELRRQLEVATSTIAHLRRMEAKYQVLATDNAQLRRQIEVAASTIAHLQRIEERYPAMASADSDARRGVQAFVDELQRILFDVRVTTPQSRSAAVLVLGNQPVDDAIATLVNLSEPAHGARPFQYMLPFLAPPVPFPLPCPAHMEPLRVVDVGSQELDFESDMFAPLRHAAPVDVVGFDPFAPLVDSPDGAVQVRRPDGGTIRTYPHLLADGRKVTFRINRFSATSSILPTNHALTGPFGLLDLALETTNTQELPSRRLDDALADGSPVDLLKVDVQGAAYTVLEHGRAVLGRTSVCHVEVEFAPVYLGERLFAEVDTFLRGAGFGFVDFFSLGRQRYAAFEGSRARAFHRGRTLWADCIYVRGLDDPETLTADELFRQALIVHTCYNKQDLAAELLGRSDALTGGALRDAYISSLMIETTR
jgi:FkbM family methyltransferase